jgi:hypothetical protein
MFLLSFTFCRAQETYQEVVTDSAYSANFKDAKIIDSALIEGYVTNNNLTPKNLNLILEKITKQTNSIIHLRSLKPQVGII